MVIYRLYHQNFLILQIKTFGPLIFCILLLILTVFCHYSLLYSMNQCENASSRFIIKLTHQQRQVINSILPKNYSLQSSQAMHNGIKNTHTRKFNIPVKQQSVTQKDNSVNKKRRIKSYQHIEHEQIKNYGNKKEQISKMIQVIRKLKKHESSWPFRMPVDPKALSIPNYNQIVLVPMDLHSIEQRIKAEKYEHQAEIQRDVNQMLLNSYKFNSKDGEYFQSTRKLQQYYQSLLKQNQELFVKKQNTDKLKKKEQPQIRNPQNEKNYQITQFQKDLANLLKKSNEMNNNQRKVRQKPVYVSTRNDGPISLKQKRQLTQQIKSLGEVHLSRIIQIVKNSKDFKDKQLKDPHENKFQGKQQIFSFDVQKLDNKTLRQLQNYVKLQKNTISHEKQESMLDSQNLYSIY